MSEHARVRVCSLGCFYPREGVAPPLVEGQRLAYGHLFNPTFATEISRIDPLPHQLSAVYDHMLKQPRLRFLLGDDAGADKAIMNGFSIIACHSAKNIHHV